MSFFKNLFGAEESADARIDWRTLNHVGQLDEIIEASKQTPVLIFKHSTRCGISRMVLKRFEHAFELTDKVTPYFLDLLAFREVSDAVSNRFNVVHQSPQLLLIRDGKCTYETSHDSIDADHVGSLI